MKTTTLKVRVGWHQISRFLLLAAFSAPTVSTFAKSIRPESLGFSPVRLEKLTEMVQRRIEAGDFSGGVTLVARDGEFVCLQAQGLMDIESQQPMRTDAIFRIMSMTKPIVACSILMLVQEGKVQLTDPISRFIPELKGLAVSEPARDASLPTGSGPPSHVAAERDITLLDLLTHTSGLMSGGASRTQPVLIGPGDTLAAVLPRLRLVPLDFQPGSQWAYSGQFGFDVLARVVEVASGMTFDRFAQERLFGPLGMKDTSFSPGENRYRIPTLYRRTKEGWLEKAAEAQHLNGTYLSGGGGLYSTAEDYMKFAQMLLNFGRYDTRQLLSREAVASMLSIQVPLPPPNEDFGMGLGVRVATETGTKKTSLSVGSFGWSGAYNTTFFVSPKERLIAIFLSQSAFLETRNQFREEFEAAVMQALVPRTTANSNDFHPMGGQSLDHALEGVWVYVGEPESIMAAPEAGGPFKFRADNRWTFTRVDPETGTAQQHFGGRYRANGSEYIETIDYSTDAGDPELGKALRFNVKIDGDIMIQTGIDNPYTEVWRRVR